MRIGARGIRRRYPISGIIPVSFQVGLNLMVMRIFISPSWFPGIGNRLFYFARLFF